MSFRATLPTEIEEKIIEQLDNDFPSLCNCALTCRAWVPRSRSLLLRAIRITTGSGSDALLDYFREKTEMRPLVQSLATAPAPTERTRLMGTYPALLFGMLPNLRRWEIRAPVDTKVDPSLVFFHPTTLTQLRCSPITELHVSSIRFTWYADFVRLISSIPHLRVLECTDLRFFGREGKSPTAVSAPPRRPLRLSTLQISQGKDSESDEGFLPCLLGLTQSSLQSLVLQPKKGFKWPVATPIVSQLRFLSLHVRQQPEYGISTLLSQAFAEVTSCVQALRCGSALERLEIHIYVSDPSNSCQNGSPCNGSISLARILSGGFMQMRCQALEKHLADRETYLTLKLHIPSFWTPRKVVPRTLREDAFPRLHKKGLLDVGYTGGNAFQSYPPHDGPVSALVVSPDGGWIASASRDVGIIWDARTRRPIHEWIMPVARRPSADPFAFSPDSKRLAYCAYVEEKLLIEIRDVEDGHKINPLPAHDFDDQAAGSLSQLMCTWFPDKLMLVSLTRFTIAVQTWDPRTFNPQSSLKYTTPFEHGSLLLSPDGRHLAGIAAAAATHSPVASKQPMNHPRPRPGGRQLPRRASRHRPHAAGRAGAASSLVNHPLCMLWDLKIGDPGEVLLNGQHGERVLDASFDRESERLALSLADHSIQIWNTKTRQLLFMTEPTTHELRGLPANPYQRRRFQMSSEVFVKAVTFTPDGRHLLSVRHIRNREGRMETLLMAWDTMSGLLLLRCDEALPPEVSRKLGLVRFSPAGTRVALAAKDGEVHVVDLLSGLRWRTGVSGGPGMSESMRFGLLPDHCDVTRLVFSPDGHTFCWGTQGGEVEIRSF